MPVFVLCTHNSGCSFIAAREMLETWTDKNSYNIAKTKNFN